jgi:hypothetical protein
MVTGYGPEDRSSVSNRDWNFIIMLEKALWPTQACREMGIGVSSLVDKAAGHWSRPLTPHEVLMLRIYAILSGVPVHLNGAMFVRKGTS